jgi:hypothetical protein
VGVSAAPKINVRIGSLAVEGAASHADARALAAALRMELGRLFAAAAASPGSQAALAALPPSRTRLDAGAFRPAAGSGAANGARIADQVFRSITRRSVP